MESTQTTLKEKNMNPAIKALTILKTNNIYTRGSFQYYGFSNGTHNFSIKGIYYSVDLITEKWEETA
jgi:hypothetical protein